MSDVSIIISTNANQVAKELKGLTGDVIGAAAQAKALANAMQFLDGAFNKGKISGEQYSAAIQKLDMAEDALYASIGKTNAAIQQQAGVIKSTSTVTSSAAVAATRLANAQRMSGKSTNKFGMYAQQVGYQVGDFNVQVQSGANALVAFGQQGTQLAGLLPGVAGAILGIGLSLATAFLRSKEQSENLSFSFKAMKDNIAGALEPIKPLLDGIASVLSFMAGVATSFGKILVENLDRIATYAIVAGSAFAGKFVAGLIAARVATFSLAGAFTLLRVAIIRTGIGLLIVGTAELILAFMKVSKAVGGIGPMLGLLKDAFFEILDKIWTKVQWMSEVVKAGFWGLVTDALSALQNLLSKVNSDFVNSFIGMMAGAIAAASESIRTLPDIFVAVFNSVKLAVANGVNSFTGIIGDGINSLRNAIGMDKLDFGPLIDTSSYSSGNVAGVLAQSKAQIKSAYDQAAAIDYVTMAQDSLSEAMNTSDFNKQVALKSAVSYDAQLQQQGTALTTLTDAYKNLDDTASGIDISSWFTEGKGKKGKGLKEKLTEAQEKIKEIADTIQSSMSSAFMSMVDGTKSVKDAFRDMARDIIKKLYEVLVVQQLVGSWDVKAGKGSGIIGFLGGLFKSANGNVFSGGSHVNAYANGGVVGGPTYFPMSGNQTGLMGEAGPEAIMPLKRGANGKLGVQVDGSAGGNITVVQHNSFGAGVSRAEIQAMMPKIVETTKAAVLDAKKRGGSYGSAFA